MINMTRARERIGWSKLRLSQEARVSPSVVGMAEAGRRTPYPPELARIKDALRWQGAPDELLQDVTDHADD